MLPETRESMPEYAELVFASGFLLLYLIDETVHYFWGANAAHTSELQRSGKNEGSQMYVSPAYSRC